MADDKKLIKFIRGTELPAVGSRDANAIYFKNVNGKGEIHLGDILIGKDHSSEINELNNAISQILGGSADDVYVLTSTYNEHLTAQSNVDAAQNERLSTLEEGIKGLTGAMHFKGVVNSDPTAEDFDVAGYVDGDVVIFGDKEYVFNGTKFFELGDVSAEGERLTALETAVETINSTTIPAAIATAEDKATELVDALKNNEVKANADAIAAIQKDIEDNRAAWLEKYDDTALSNRVAALEAIDHDFAAADEVLKQAIQGNTSVTVESCVLALNKMNGDLVETKDQIVEVNNFLDMFTWKDYSAE